MKTFSRLLLCGLLFFLVGMARSQTIPFGIALFAPTNHQAFLTPANIYVHARVTDSNVVQTVQYFAGTTSIGLATNTAGLLYTNSTQGNPLFITWSNVPPGAYALTAVASDSAGMMVTSAPVNITVSNPVVRPSVYIYSPTNGAKFLAPANLNLYARAAESSNAVATVEFFANNLSLGVVPNSSQMVFSNISSEPLFPLGWSNVLTGTYALKAVATDVKGNSATSSVVSITVATNFPPPVVRPSVYIYSPANGSTYLAPTNVNIYARAVESTGLVATVTFYANSINLGVVSNSSQVIVSNISSVPVFPLTWLNPPAGSFALKAVATDTNGNSATSSVVNITVITNVPPPPPIPFLVAFWYPTNGQTFKAPATIGVHALVVDSNVVQTIQYFANGSGIGIVTNTGGVLLTNSTQGNPFFLSWSNVLAGNYGLTAVATDNAGNTATSSVVNVTVTNAPPVIGHPSVAIYSPQNGATYHTPTNVNIYARAVETSGMVASVEFFANNVSLGVVPNSSQLIVSNISSVPVFPFTWSNPATGGYALKVIATDTNGYTATSSVVNIYVLTNPPPPVIPFTVAFWYPTNGQMFLAPANVGVHARVTDSNVVETVEYFANGSSIGTVSNTGGVLLTSSTQANPFFLDWSNVPAGAYALTAVALDSAGNTATSAPVNIYVVTNLPPVITMYATDPVAIEGTNYVNWYYPTSTISSYVSNYVSGANTATFLVHRSSATNTDLTVYYSIGGTAINGEDYAELPGTVMIPAGKSYALITIYPLNDSDSDYRHYDTVVLSLLAAPVAYNSPGIYSIGSPAQAGAIILEED
ncbi:MAG TPA: Ig-like domain-containing protein, partial [Candidatus Acidoferrales bacterium]|nr:Ig-like domain-containing protein [Candidatus Acidoferrales bacterium]